MAFRIHVQDDEHIDVIDSETTQVIVTLVFGPRTPKWLREAVSQIPFFLSMLKKG